MNISYTLEQIRLLIGDLELEGSTDATITGFASLSKAGPSDLSFLGNKKYSPEVGACGASIVLLPKSYVGKPKEGQVYIRVDNPSLSLGNICADVEKTLWPKPKPGIHPTAIIAEDSELASDVYIGPGCIIEEGVTIEAGTILDARVSVGRNAKIGKNSRLRTNVTVGDYCVIGDRVNLHVGVVLGADGFGYETSSRGEHHKIAQIGNVVIEDDVEIGANTTIDRARFDSTRIGKGAKIDNLVQIAHNVDIGEHCIIVSQTGISGSTILGSHVVMAGQSGAAGHLMLGQGCVVGAKSGVSRNLEAGKVYRGIPAIESIITNKVDALKKRLPQLFKRVSDIEDRLKKDDE